MKDKDRTFLKPRTKEQAKDTSMAVVLLLLLLSVILHSNVLVIVAVVTLVVAMTIPSLFRPLAILWFGATELLGMLMSTFLLSILFFVIITPIGLLRRLFGKDELLLRRFKFSNGSVMKVRDHTFKAADLGTPF